MQGAGEDLHFRDGYWKSRLAGSRAWLQSFSLSSRTRSFSRTFRLFNSEMMLSLRP